MMSDELLSVNHSSVLPCSDPARRSTNLPAPGSEGVSLACSSIGWSTQLETQLSKSPSVETKATRQASDVRRGRSEGRLMDQNTNPFFPAVSAAPSSRTPSEDAAANQAWATYYRNLQQNTALVAQYQAQGFYNPYATTQDYHGASSAQITANYAFSSLQPSGYVQPTTMTASTALPATTVDDPLPPGNEDIEIPGLGPSTPEAQNHQEGHSPSGSAENSSSDSVHVQQFMQRQGNSAKTTDTTKAASSGNAATDASRQELYLQQLQPEQFIAYQQYNTVVGAQKNQQVPGLEARAPPVLSAGFNFKNPQTVATASAPFLIKPGIPEKTKPAAPPAYISIPPPQPSTEVLLKPKQETEEAQKTVNKPPIDPPVQRKRRKFEKNPPPMSKPLHISTIEEELKKQERSARFSRLTVTAPSYTPEEPKHKSKLIGTSQDLEKSYFRLSCRPDPSVVRPESVLEKALKRLVALLSQKEVDYFYAVDQFKGMRQDCTVQQLQSETCVRIYEASARAHLEYGDIWEYNQCQSNLEALYKIGIHGCRSEFVAYRILYQVMHINKGEAISMNKTIRTLDPQDRQATEVQHALKLTAAFIQNDLAQVFALYAQAPNLGRALVDHVLDEVRYKAARLFIKSIRLQEPVDALVKPLGFYCEEAIDEQGEEILPGCTESVHCGGANLQTDRKVAVQNCVEWLKAHGAVIIEGDNSDVTETLIDPVASRSKLFKAKAENAVAHGDPNLDMSYFLVK